MPRAYFYHLRVAAVAIASMEDIAGSSFCVEAMIRGYHVYEDIWSAVVGEELPCKRERTNTADPFAVSVVKEETTVDGTFQGR